LIPEWISRGFDYPIKEAWSPSLPDQCLAGMLKEECSGFCLLFSERWYSVKLGGIIIPPRVKSHRIASVKVPWKEKRSYFAIISGKQMTGSSKTRDNAPKMKIE
jgi:hypothetical protein